MARWYIIHAYSGFENKVRDQILAEAERIGLSQLVEAVEVPTEQVTEVRRGKKIKAERKFFPGYVLAKLNMNDDVYHLVKNTPKVTGFLGHSKPQPISEAEAARIYAISYGKDPDFYDFYRAMQSYRQTFQNGEGATNIILSPQNAYLEKFRNGR